MTKDTVSELGYLAGATRFRRIGEKLQSDGDRMYSEFNIDFKASWFATYYTLLHAGKPFTMQDIAASIGFTHITVKNIVREMQEHGLVKITANPGDARSKHVLLTAKGKALYNRLRPVWQSVSKALEQLLTSGHPDFINMIGRIETEMEKKLLPERIKDADKYHAVQVVDFKPSLKTHFYELAGKWLSAMLNGKLEDEDVVALKNPEKIYLANGGFVFFALYSSTVAGLPFKE